MQWPQEGTHCLLQTRTAVLNDDLPRYFESWHPGLQTNGDRDRQMMDYKKAV